MCYEDFRYWITFFSAYRINWTQESDSYYYINISDHPHSYVNELKSSGWEQWEGNTWRVKL